MGPSVHTSPLTIHDYIRPLTSLTSPLSRLSSLPTPTPNSHATRRTLFSMGGPVSRSRCLAGPPEVAHAPMLDSFDSLRLEQRTLIDDHRRSLSTRSNRPELDPSTWGALGTTAAKSTEPEVRLTYASSVTALRCLERIKTTRSWETLAFDDSRTRPSGSR